MKEVKTGTYIRIVENGDKTCNFNFYTDLSVASKLEFVNSVVDILIDENHYNSVIRDLIFDFYVVAIMTDIDTSKLAASDDFLNDTEQFLKETNIVEIVKKNANPALFDELNNAIDKSIQYLTGIHTNSLNDALASLLFTIEKKINEVDLGGMMGVVEKIESLTKNSTIEDIVNAYMNSDVHKRNMNEIEESKKQRAKFAKDLDNAIKTVNKENI